MLSALLTVLILLAVWCVPAAVAETASADSANEEGADDPSSSYLYGGIACLKDHYYFFPRQRTVCCLKSPCPAGLPWGWGRSRPNSSWATTVSAIMFPAAF